MTPEERAKDIVGLLYAKPVTIENMEPIRVVIAGHIKAALKDQRREIHDKILLSELANKDEVTAVIFPPTPPKKEKWVDLSQDKK